MFVVILIALLAVMTAVAIAALNKVGLMTMKAVEAEERVEQLLWLHNATICRMNTAITAKENAETDCAQLVRELNEENTKLAELVLSLEAALEVTHNSNII